MPPPDETAHLLMLRRAATPQQRLEAVEFALLAGVSLTRIEEYLDWLDGGSLAADGTRREDGQGR